ncbi:hypothetical protein ACQEVG_04230 [Streptomyces sp. CA-135486]|uniref:hypothetical protein n=1 Tax=Streptomyces sp. CA-135486 TaxID=3240049 RepID=UPI003D8C7007
MPRPTAAQLAYGSATVVFSTLALLLLTRTSHVLGVAAIGAASMAIGLVVAAALPMGRTRGPRKAKATRTVRTNHSAASAMSTTAASADGLTTRVTAAAARARTGAEALAAQHSLRR